MKPLLLLFLLLATSCSIQPRRVYVCDTQERQHVAEFVSKNTHPSNTVSKVEVERVIAALFETGVMTHCRQELLPAKFNGDINWKLIKKDPSETYFPYIY